MLNRKNYFRTALKCLRFSLFLCLVPVVLTHKSFLVSTEDLQDIAIIYRSYIVTHYVQGDCIFRQGLTEPSGKKLALVTSMYAKSDDGVYNSHRTETVAALALNTANCYLDEVRVILDSVHSNYTCEALKDEILTSLKLANGALCVEFECIDRFTGQPSYFELFEYTTDRSLTGHIIILANADMLFDETVRYLKPLDTRVVHVVATQGEPPYRHRRTLNRQGIATVGEITNRCYQSDFRSSWDAFIFNQGSVRWQEKDFVANTEPKIHFTPNTESAENWALYNLKRNSPVGVKFRQSCDVVHMWHVHYSPKMHSNRTLEVTEEMWDVHGDDCKNPRQCVVY